MPRVVIRVISLAAFLASGICSAEEWIALELYVNGGESEQDVQTWAESALSDRECVSLRIYDLSADDGGQERYDNICSYYKLDGAESAPLLYGCGKTVVRPESEEALRAALNEMLTMTVFVRSGCPRCARARQYLEPTMRNYPGFRIVYRDIATDRQASSDMQAVARRYRQSAVSVPVFHFCNQVIVGFDRESTTGRRLESALDHWTFTREDSSLSVPPDSADSVQLASPLQQSSQRRGYASESPQSESMFRLAVGRNHIQRTIRLLTHSFACISDPADPAAHGRDPPTGAESNSDDESNADADPPPLPLPGPPPLPLPPDLPLPAGVDGVETDPAESTEFASESPPAEDLFYVPFHGEVSASELSRRYGLPAFTIVIGLIDGFNPCAMWVLLFLLSILVNLKSRWKILAVAGTFVFISGLAYFAFMAAWLTVWSWFQYLRPAEVVLGLLAVGIGAIHIKDFFAFRKGISLSIPESAKPGIYARVRRIVMAENIWGAIAGASVLAVLVNVIELLCTAGLPALYTNVLTKQGLATWHEYAYIGLYNLAYMFDDGLMVAAVVLTLGRHKLQERQGRWLKLLSGLVVLLLGLVLLFNPELLQWEFGVPAE